MKQEIKTIDLGGVNAYIIQEDGANLLIDTGGPMMTDKPYNDRRELLVQKLNDLGCTKENLKLIVLTHGDCDHCMHAAYLSKLYDAPIAMHSADIPMTAHLTPELCLRNSHFRSLLLRIMGKLIHKLMVKYAEAVTRKFETFTPQIILADHQTLDSYGFHVTILSLPGHTPGSIAIYTSDHSLICGDLYNNTKKPSPAMNALDFKQVDQSIKSLHNLPIQRYYPGHGTSFQL